MQHKIISLFAGCGGADLGLIGGFKFNNKNYPKLPLELVHASDIDQKAINTYNLNFKVHGLTVDVKKLKFSRGSADFVVGGFPCQSFSTVNPTKDPEDDRGQLFLEMVRIVKSVQPKVFIAENVKGFYTLQGGRYFNFAVQKFTEAGYKVYSEVLDASDYGVPQKRQRLFMIGIRKDIKKIYHFPIKTHGPGLKKSKSVLGDVIESLVPDDEKYYFSQRAVDGVKKAKNNMKRALAQELGDQCLTITSHLAKVSLNSRDPVLLVNPKKELYRRFTPREAARIQSFPDKFIFGGSEGDAYRQIGNAIPPVLMWNICKSILEILD